jgi:dihydrofolate synthase / folylpolyglutamate synthase
LRPNLFGEIQLHNATVAYSAIELAHLVKDRSAVAPAFEKAYLPGRFQRIEYKGKRFIVDGAHNADSASVLQKLLEEANIRPKVCITGMLNGHSVEEFFETFDKSETEYFVTPIDFHRSRNAQDLGDELTNMGFKTRVFETVKAAIDATLRIDDTEEILVCGSFYLVGEIMRLLQSE